MKSETKSKGYGVDEKNLNFLKKMLDIGNNGIYYTNHQENKI
jgi:hypothetical protein